MRVPEISVATALAIALLTGGACAERSEYSGPSLAFDGDADHARVGTVPADHPLALAGSTMTVAAWFRQAEGGDAYQRLVDKSDGFYGKNGWALAGDGDAGQIHFYVHDGERGGDFVSGRASYARGRWHHAAGVARADRLEIFLDGSLDRDSFYEDGAHTLPARAETEMRIGTWNHDVGREWKGEIGEIAVWRRDLRPEEIREIADAGGRLDLRENAGRYAGAADLVGYWRMEGDGRHGSRIADLSPTGAHATILRTGDPEIP